MNKRMGKRQGVQQKGQALVELALTLPLILLLILGAVDFGRMFYHKIVITNAAREGANYLSRNHDEITETLALVSAYCADAGVTLESIAEVTANYNPVNIVYEAASDFPIDEMSNVVVTIYTSEDLIFGFLLEALGLTDGEIIMNGSARMLVQ